MQVIINRENTINNFATRDITNLNIDEYADITFSLEFRLEYLEEKLEEYKNAEDTRLKEFIPKKESEILRIKELINLMQ